MTKAYFLALANYNNWTDDIAIEWLNQINAQQWEQFIPSSFSSVQQTVTHIVSAKKIWIDFWTEALNPVYLSAGFKGTKAELITLWKGASVDLKTFIENFPEENYQQVVNLIYPDGRKGQMLFWQTFPHFINHATYHRGQLVTLLRQTGFNNFTNTDLATFFMKHI